MKKIVRTIYAAALQSAQFSGLKAIFPENSTLNEKFNVQSRVLPAASEIPRARYLTIGNGGHDMVTSNGISKTVPSQHRSRDAALYSHLPFVLRLPENDLSSTERARYGLRTTFISPVDNQTYIAYYLRRMDLTNVVVGMTYHAVSGDGSEQRTPFVPNSGDLSPTKLPPSNNSVNVTSGDYLSAEAPVTITFTPDEVDELINVANLIWNDSGLAIISELGIVSGVDKVVDSPGVGNNTIQINEVIGATMMTFVSVFYQLSFERTGITINANLGATEPLLQTNNTSSSSTTST